VLRYFKKPLDLLNCEIDYPSLLFGIPLNFGRSLVNPAPFNALREKMGKGSECPVDRADLCLLAYAIFLCLSKSKVLIWESGVSPKNGTRCKRRRRRFITRSLPP
jgi:hypothetical protein